MPNNKQQSKKNSQIGVMTLSVVVSILVMSALFAFSVMQTARDHFKKMQNIILSAQEKAQVTASLNCAIAVFNQYMLEPNNLDVSKFTDCKTDAEIIFSLIEHDDYWQLMSSKGASHVKTLFSYTKPQNVESDVILTEHELIKGSSQVMQGSLHDF